MVIITFLTEDHLSGQLIYSVQLQNHLLKSHFLDEGALVVIYDDYISYNLLLTRRASGVLEASTSYNLEIKWYGFWKYKGNLVL